MFPPDESFPAYARAAAYQPWPSPEKKPSFAATSNNGGDYISHHKSLLRSYAAPWLLAVHDQDAVFYGKTCFELVVEIAEDTHDAEVGEENVCTFGLLTVYCVSSFRRWIYLCVILPGSAKRSSFSPRSTISSFCGWNLLRIGHWIK
jgi:hypothetical protein